MKTLQPIWWLEPLILHLFENRPISDEEISEYCFDYPDYGGLPKKIVKKLTSDQLDIIQEYCGHWFEIKNFNSFRKTVAHDLSHGTIIIK